MNFSIPVIFLLKMTNHCGKESKDEKRHQILNEKWKLSRRNYNLSDNFDLVQSIVCIFARGLLYGAIIFIHDVVLYGIMQISYLGQT